jgi:hypothetical protein
MKWIFSFLAAALLCSSAAGRQLSIYSTGFGDNAEQIIEQARFYADELNITSGQPLIVMVMLSHNLPDNISGMMVHGENEVLEMRNVMIKLNAALPTDDLSRTLAHEMMHVAQYARGDLMQINNTMFRWQGQLIFDSATIPYRQRKWEKEAFTKEEGLRKAYKKLIHRQ